MFEFGAPGFWELVHEVRLRRCRRRCSKGVPLVVATFCYTEPDDRVQLEQFEATVQRDGGELLPVFLHCDAAETARRIGNPDRAARRKLSSMQDLDAFCAAFNLTPVPRDHCLILNTTAVAPEIAAAQTPLRHFRLDSVDIS